MIMVVRWGLLVEVDLLTTMEDLRSTAREYRENPRLRDRFRPNPKGIPINAVVLPQDQRQGQHQGLAMDRLDRMATQIPDMMIEEGMALYRHYVRALLLQEA
jgi:hypothetical protein